MSAPESPGFSRREHVNCTAGNAPLTSNLHVCYTGRVPLVINLAFREETVGGAGGGTWITPRPAHPGGRQLPQWDWTARRVGPGSMFLPAGGPLVVSPETIPEFVAFAQQSAALREQLDLPGRGLHPRRLQPPNEKAWSQLLRNTPGGSVTTEPGLVRWWDAEPHVGWFADGVGDDVFGTAFLYHQSDEWKSTNTIRVGFVGAPKWELPPVGIDSGKADEYINFVLSGPDTHLAWLALHLDSEEILVRRANHNRRAAIRAARAAFEEAAPAGLPRLARDATSRAAIEVGVGADAWAMFSGSTTYDFVSRETFGDGHNLQPLPSVFFVKFVETTETVEGEELWRAVCDTYAGKLYHASGATPFRAVHPTRLPKLGAVSDVDVFAAHRDVFTQLHDHTVEYWDGQRWCALPADINSSSNTEEDV